MLIRWSFRLKTIVGVVLIEAALLAVLVYCGLRFMAATAQTEFAQRSLATVKTFAVVARPALVAGDVAALQALVQEMLAFPGVAYARVRGAQRQALAWAGDAQGLLADEADSVPEEDDTVLSAWIGTTPPDPARPARLSKLERDVEVEGRTVGQVEIGLSAQEVRAVQSDAWRYGLGLAGLDMLLVGLCSWGLGAFLTRQLDALAHAARQVAEGDLGFQVPVRGHDALAQTAQAFNSMSVRLAEGYAELQRSEQGLRRVLENVHDGIVTLDRHLRVLTMSPAAERILHRSTAEAQGRLLADGFTPTAWSRICDALDLADDLLLGEPLVIDGVLPDGQLVPLEVRLRRIEGSGPATLLVVLRDVRERLEAERALRLRGRIIDAIGVGVLISDARLPDQPIVYANVAFERMTGWRFEEVRGRNCRFLQGPLTDRAEVRRLRSAIDRGQDVEVLLRNYTKHGRLFWNALRIMALHDTEGRLSHYFALQDDVTDRIESQQQLALSAARLRRVLDATHDAIVVVDHAGMLETFNAAAERLFGYTAREVIGRPATALVPALQRGPTAGEQVCPARRKDGQTVWITLRVALLEDEADHDDQAAAAAAVQHRRYIGVAHRLSQSPSVPAAIAAPPSPALPARPVLDPDRYAQVRAVMGEATGALLDEVARTLASERALIAQALQAGDRVALRDLLHRLKNTAGDIGALPLHALAAQCERDALSCDSPLVSTMPDLSPLDDACAAALAAVQQHRLALAPVLRHP